ncbi:16713_t:CDS:1, partial [Racocetra fulgida]
SRVINIDIALVLEILVSDPEFVSRATESDPEYTIASDSGYVSGILGVAAPNTKCESESAAPDLKYILELPIPGKLIPRVPREAAN